MKQVLTGNYEFNIYINLYLGPKNVMDRELVEGTLRLVDEELSSSTKFLSEKKPGFLG